MRVTAVAKRASSSGVLEHTKHPKLKRLCKRGPSPQPSPRRGEGVIVSWKIFRTLMGESRDDGVTHDISKMLGKPEAQRIVMHTAAKEALVIHVQAP